MLYDLKESHKRNELNPGFWNQFTNRDLLTDFPLRSGRAPLPAVNVMENENEFILELASPGMCKDNYKLEVENDVLTISGDVREKNSEEQRNYTRKEFHHVSFERSFMLPEYVDDEHIAASCADGILTIHIPKKENEYVSRKRKINIG